MGILGIILRWLQSIEKQCRKVANLTEYRVRNTFCFCDLISFPIPPVGQPGTILVTTEISPPFTAAGLPGPCTLIPTTCRFAGLGQTQYTLSDSVKFHLAVTPSKQSQHYPRPWFPALHFKVRLGTHLYTTKTPKKQAFLDISCKNTPRYCFQGINKVWCIALLINGKVLHAFYIFNCVFLISYIPHWLQLVLFFL